MSERHSAPDLTYKAASALLSRLGKRDDIVLVGGQAVNFWAEQYIEQQQVPELLRDAPYTSKDIDFCADRKAVEQCAMSLGLTPFMPSSDSFDPLNAGKIVIEDAAGIARDIDFVTHPFGLDAQDVRRTSLSAQLLDDEGNPTETQFRVIQPVLLMMSRVHNVVGLPNQYDNPRGLKQLRASIICAREFLIQLLKSDLEKPARALAEKIFHFCISDQNGRSIFEDKGIDPFDAVPLHPGYCEKFRITRYPQMKERLASRRARIARSRDLRKRQKDAATLRRSQVD